MLKPAISGAGSISVAQASRLRLKNSCGTGIWPVRQQMDRHRLKLRL
ncbi:MAG: hypothetical protein KME26_30520 [Oscillatoria princeps RMCB-10]|nr:hypothetical protein [Oscillatoria princeps RMCB-10]